jgi:hypothetical protein
MGDQEWESVIPPRKNKGNMTGALIKERYLIVLSVEKSNSLVEIFSNPKK